MRPASLVPLATFLILIPAVAHAQYGGSLDPRDREDHRERPPSHADSTRTLAGAWQIWGRAGVGWLGSPSDMRSRYNAGMDVGASGERRFADRVALSARLEFSDLPSRQPNVIFVNGIAYSTNTNYGHGWFGLGFGGVAVRTFGHLWVEGGAGSGHFESGFPSGQTFVDGATGQIRRLDGDSGWGSAWSAGARYEFQPTLRDRMLAELQFSSMDRGGTRLRFWALRIGYRAF